MENNQIVKENTSTHRVGSVTLGLALVLFGILFLVHMFLPELDYQMIFHLWPCIFILLGIEILVGNHWKKEEFFYDKGAIALIIILSLFAMVMGVIDFSMEQYAIHISYM